MDADEEEERPEYYATTVCLLHCKPGNFDHAAGEPACIVTVGRSHSIEPLVFSMGDSRQLVTKLLVALATNEDAFAHKLLDDHFGADGDGNYVWPQTPKWL